MIGANLRNERRPSLLRTLIIKAPVVKAAASRRGCRYFQYSVRWYRRARIYGAIL
jgi:hypothetical protein